MTTVLPSGRGRPLVPTGWLRYDATRLITPEPDPVHEAVKHDPAVVAAEQAERDAERAYNAADEAWEDAISKHASARLRVRHDKGSWGVFSQGWKPSREAAEDLRRLPALADAVEQTAKTRERAGEELQEARVAYGAALRAHSADAARPLLSRTSHRQAALSARTER